MPPLQETLERIRTALEGLETGAPEGVLGTACVEVGRDVLHDALTRLKERAGFETVTFVTAVDRLRELPPGDSSAGRLRFEVVHQLHSVTHSDRVRVKTRLREDAASVPTCTDLWPGASFMERECFDMFGIRFDGHPDLRRLLMPEGYDHHPLLKDFPHHGIEPERLYREWDEGRRKAGGPA